jgi:hypothetical protein
MWRNVHGHAIYQIILLMVVLFKGQGLLCRTYDTRCVMTDGKVCDQASLNPFYSSTLYYETDT